MSQQTASSDQAANKKPKRRGRWKPGQSGNPGGRPKVAGDLRDLARTYTHTAVATLVSIMSDHQAPAAARVTAANALLDRGHGKPIQAMEHTGKDGGLIEYRLSAEGRALLDELLPAMVVPPPKANGATKH
jgi:hypothetical protein